MKPDFTAGPNSSGPAKDSERRRRGGSDTVMNIRPMITAFALLLVCLSAFALEIYRWTDADGVVHFSESPPDDPRIPVQTLLLEEHGDTASGDLKEVLDVADRLEASRLAREQARAEAAEASREAQRQAAPQETTEPREVPVYVYPPHRRYPPPGYPMPPWPKPVMPPPRKPVYGRVPPPAPGETPAPAVGSGSGR